MGLHCRWNDMRIAVVDINIGTESIIRNSEAIFSELIGFHHWPKHQRLSILWHWSNNNGDCLLSFLQVLSAAPSMLPQNEHYVGQG